MKAMISDQIKHSNVPPCGSLEVCTGCSACAAICPVNCISMRPNEEGFLYPVVDEKICTNCGICRQICPVNPERISANKTASKGHRSEPLAIFAAWHLNEQIRHESSSGGVFTALAENILHQGGIVVGAAFDDQFTVRHIIIESVGDIARLRGSKYVQSEISTSLYCRIRELLRQNRPVLFSGTPCQVAGLRGFLGQPYGNLYCCDLICHGVPSPMLLDRYLEYKSSKYNRLVKINFRDKTLGWKVFGVCQHYKDESKTYSSMWSDPYILAFLKNYDLRESCYACNFTNVNRFGDLTIADFWGVKHKYPEYDCEDKGTSLVLVNNEKGQAWLTACSSTLFLGPADLETAIAGNPMLVRSCLRPPQRDDFYSDLSKLSFRSLIRKYKLMRQSIFRRVLSSFKRRLIAVLRSVMVKSRINKNNSM